MNDFSISREQLESELREYSQTLELVAAVKSAPLAAQEAREELPHVLAFIAHLEATAKAAPAKKSGARCAWYRDIRRCYAVAREAGLDVKADAKMRESFGRFLGREIESREELRAGDWYLIASEIKAHRLSW